MKFKYKLFSSRIVIIFIIVSLFVIPLNIKQTEDEFCYKSESSFWGRQDLRIDCESNNVDLVKNGEYLDFGIRQFKGIAIATLIINFIVWISGIESKNYKEEGNKEK